MVNVGFKFQQRSTMLIGRSYFFLLLLLQLHVFLILFIIIFLLVWLFKHILIHRSYFISRFLRFLQVLNKINSKLQIQHGVVPVRFLIIKKVIMASLLLLKIIIVLANFMIYSDISLF